jgi:hypothetical protein
MSQGTWGPCTKDSSGNTVPKRGYLCAPVGPANSLVQRGWFSIATGWEEGADRYVAFYDDSGIRLSVQGDGAGALPVNGRQ